MNQAVVLGNNDVAFIAWSYDDPIDDCLGFAVYRQSSSQPAPTPLPAWVGFEGTVNTDWRPSTTEVWPIQKFSWRDLTASADATCPGSFTKCLGRWRRARRRFGSSIGSPGRQACWRRWATRASGRGGWPARRRR